MQERTCQRLGCEAALPPGSRSDRKWCSRACQSWANKRANGEVVENAGRCTSCLQPLAGLYANARVCRSTMCRTWAQRHPGMPHPSVAPRVCKQCCASIDHLNGKAKFCRKACRNQWLVEQDREAYNAKARAWQSSERGKTYRKAYQQANAERRQQWARDSRAQDPERYYRYWRQWVEANPEAAAEAGRRRRARKLGNPDSIGVSVRDWERLVARFRGCCAYCGGKAEPLHMDHVVPLAKGGRHAIGNVLPACGRCNVRKHAMFLSVWRYRGRRRSLSA